MIDYINDLILIQKMKMGILRYKEVGDRWNGLILNR